MSFFSFPLISNPSAADIPLTVAEVKTKMNSPVSLFQTMWFLWVTGRVDERHKSMSLEKYVFIYFCMN